MTTNERIAIINDGIDLLMSTNSDIKSVVSIGSFSQGAIDRFSDIDLYLFTNNVSKYMNAKNNDWVTPLGRGISRRVFKDIREGVEKNKVVLENGLMYDLTIVNIKRFNVIKYYFSLQKISFHRLLPKFLRQGIEGNIVKFYETIKRGYKIHKDEMGLENILKKAMDFSAKRENVKISERVFFNRYHHFWQSCYTASVKLLRGDFYFVMLVYNHYIITELVKMIEWDTLVKDESVDVYYDSLKIKQWAGEQVYQDLFGTMLHSNIAEMQRALVRSAKLYQKFSSNVAKKHNFSLNENFETFVLDFIEKAAMQQHENSVAAVN